MDIFLNVIKHCNVNFTALFNACDLLCIFNNVTLRHDMSL